MKNFRWMLLFCMLLNLGCKKHNSTPYAGTYYIRVPFLEANEQMSYFTSYAGDLDVNLDRVAWKFIPVGAKGYYIQTDSTNFRIIEQNGFARVIADTAASSYPQIFRVVPSAANPNLVAFQSYSSGKFIQVDFCYYQGETWWYGIPITDSSSCGAYGGLVARSNVGDTCYCVNQFVLER